MWPLLGTVVSFSHISYCLYNIHLSLVLNHHTATFHIYKSNVWGCYIAVNVWSDHDQAHTSVYQTTACIIYCGQPNCPFCTPFTSAILHARVLIYIYNNMKLCYMSSCRYIIFLLIFFFVLFHNGQTYIESVYEQLVHKCTILSILGG